MDKLNLRDIIITVGTELRNEYFRNPENHQDSETFRKALKIIESIEIQHLKIPQFLPNRITQGQLHLQTGLRISLFYVPKGCQTKLHDHPGMYVISKVLRGKLLMNKYKLQNNNHQVPIPQAYVKLESREDQTKLFPKIIASKAVDILNVGQIDVVTPEDNLHMFEAEEDSIFMDVIAPDYDNIEIFMNTYLQIETLEDDKVTLQMGPPKMQRNHFMDVDFL